MDDVSAQDPINFMNL